MQKIRLGISDLSVSRIGYGCMYIGGGWNDVPLSPSERESAIKMVRTAMDAGIDFFDHADIYCLGKSEQAFAGLWHDSPHLRQQVYLQTKCGIRFGPPVHRFDFSYQHIISSVEGSLERLETDYLDLLLLHRPDPLIEPEEVGRAFDALHSAGKVRWFGVSNHTAAQIAFLQPYLNQPLVVNQVEFNLVHTHLLDEGIVFNQNVQRPTRNEGTMEYCRLHEITLQAWAPLANGWVTGNPRPDAPAHYKAVEVLVSQMAAEKGVSPEAILIAWILRHPARIQPLPGTTNPNRIQAACQADSIQLTREEWYRLFTAGRGENLP